MGAEHKRDESQQGDQLTHKGPKVASSQTESCLRTVESKSLFGKACSRLVTRKLLVLNDQHSVSPHIITEIRLACHSIPRSGGAPFLLQSPIIKTTFLRACHWILLEQVIPRDPSQITPTSGPIESVNIAYIGLFRSLGQ